MGEGVLDGHKIGMSLAADLLMGRLQCSRVGILGLPAASKGVVSHASMPSDGGLFTLQAHPDHKPASDSRRSKAPRVAWRTSRRRSSRSKALLVAVNA